MTKYQNAKKIVRAYFDAIEQATPETVADVLRKHTTGDDYLFRSVYPLGQQHGTEAAAQVFWVPLMKSLTRMQRRQDIFIGGTNEIGG